MTLACFTVPLSVAAVEYALGEFVGQAGRPKLIVSPADESVARMILTGPKLLQECCDLEVQTSMPVGQWEMKL